MSIADFSEVFELADALRDSGANIAPKVRSGITRARNTLAGTAAQRAPRDTGELAASFETEGTGFEQRVVNRTRQAFFQQFGTSRHPPQPVLLDYEDETQADLEREVFESLGRLL